MSLVLHNQTIHSKAKMFNNNRNNHSSRSLTSPLRVHATMQYSQSRTRSAT
ncbi:hypothetical protein AAM22_gp93 [Pantoea phage vB_PagM_AAM22]|nr:hypothetical protein AAM22_gp93 [Pantoea phage vB_PagM_AAM22]